MRIAMILATIAVAVAAAQADPFEGLYGNTVTSTSPKGKVYVYYFNKDGTFENHYPSGGVFKGIYVWKDATTACFTVTDPPPAPGENTTNCRPFTQTHHVGDVWTETDSDGVVFTNAITAGRH
jgi:hypothetical protein